MMYKFFPVLAMIMFLACSDTEQNTGKAERIAEDGTLVVRDDSKGRWGGSMQLVEEMSIGVLEGDDMEMFGRISNLAVDADGGIYVFDGQA